MSQTAGQRQLAGWGRGGHLRVLCYKKKEETNVFSAAHVNAHKA